MLKVAKCENCGAALRVSVNTDHVQCEYCRAMLIAVPRAGHAPTLRIAQAPLPTFINLETQAKAVLLPAIGVPIALAGVYTVQSEGQLGGLLYIAFGALMLLAGGASARLWRDANRKRADLQWLRDHGAPGRATVQVVRGRDGRRVALGLRVELQGTEPWFQESETVVPTMLVPRVVDGLTLPVLVDPTDPSNLEIQWHLV